MIKWKFDTPVNCEYTITRGLKMKYLIILFRFVMVSQRTARHDLFSGTGKIRLKILKKNNFLFFFIKNLLFHSVIGAVSVFSSDPPCKDGNT